MNIVLLAIAAISLGALLFNVNNVDLQHDSKLIEKGRNQAIHQLAVRITAEEPLPLEKFKVWQDAIAYLHEVDWNNPDAGSKAWQDRLRKEQRERDALRGEQ